MADIDKLEIEIEASSAQAVAQIKALNNELKGLKSTLNGKWNNPIKNVGASAGTAEKRSTSGTGGKTSQKPPQAEFSDVQQETRRMAESTTGNVEEATEKVNRFREAFSKLKNVVSSVGKTISRGVISDIKGLGNTAQNAAKGLGQLAKSGIHKIFDRAVSPVRNFAKGLTNLVSSFKRILFYRMVRTVIKQIGDAFREGTNNVYQWSKALGGAFAVSMDSAATSMQYLKNSVGAAVAPILTALIPALNAAVNAVVSLINVLNQLFAALGGGGTYIKAVRANTEFAKSAGGAAKAAKDFTLGIDELNVINDSQGGGGGSGGADYGSMFEYDDIDSGISDFAAKVRAAIEKQDWMGLGSLFGDKLNEMVDAVPWEEFGGKIGEKLTMSFQTALGFLRETDFQNIGASVSSLINGAMEATDFDSIGRAAARALTSIPDTIIGFLSELDWGSVTKSVGEYITGVFNEFSDWLNEVDWEEFGNTLWQKIKDAIAGVDWGALAESVFRFFGTSIRTSVEFLFGFISGIGQDIADWWAEDIQGADFGETASNLLSAFITAVGDISLWAYEYIIDPFISALTNDENWDVDLAGFFSQKIEDIRIAIETKWAEVKEFVNNLPEMIKTGIMNALGWFASLPGKIGYYLGLVPGKIVRFGVDVGAAIREEVPKLIEEAVEFFRDLPQKIYDEIIRAKDELIAWALELKQTIEEKIPEVKQRVVDFFAELPGNLRALGTKIVDGFIGGIAAAWHFVTEKVSEWVGGFVSGFKDGLGIGQGATDSSEFKSIGGSVISGLLSGISDAWGTITEFFEGSWEDLKTWWQGLELPSFKIKSPHLSWSSEPADGAIATILGALGLPTSIPKLSVSWYAKGGIVDGATLIGAGEAGKEAIIPLERNTEWIDRVAERISERNGQGDADEEQTALLREQNELLRAILAKTGVSIDGKTIKSAYDRATRNAGAGIMSGGVFA